MITLQTEARKSFWTIPTLAEHKPRQSKTHNELEGKVQRD